MPFSHGVPYSVFTLLTACLFTTFGSSQITQAQTPATLLDTYQPAVSKVVTLECPEFLYLGVVVQFQGGYSNEGEVPIDNVTFSVNVSPELSLSDFTTTQGTWTPGTQDGFLSMGTVAPGVTVTFTFLISADVVGTSTLTTQFSGQSSESCNIEIIPPSGTVFAEKYKDVDGNGMRDDAEPGLEGWEFFLDENDNNSLDGGERTAMTDTSGLATFETVPLGTYGLIELPRDGWVITEPDGFPGYSVELNSPGAQLIGRFGNFRVPLYDPIATTMDHELYWVVDRFGSALPDGTFDFTVGDVPGSYDHTYMNLFIDFNGDGMIAPYPISKDDEQDEWVVRNTPLPGSEGLTSSPRWSSWFPLKDFSLDLEAEYDYAFGLTDEPIEADEGIPIELVQLDLIGSLPFMTFAWGANDLNGQEVDDTPEPEPEPFPEISFVDFIPGPLDPNGMPDITQKHNECGPTSAANSLIWLARKHSFTDRLPQKDGEIDQDQLILDLMQAMAGNQNRPFDGLRGNQLFDGKKKYIMEKNLPLVVEGGNTDANASGAKTFEFVRNEIDKGQDVELLVKWPGPGSHWVTISGYAVSNEKKAVLFVHDPDDGKTSEVVWELEVNADTMITGKVISPSESRTLWAVAESPVANIRTDRDGTVPQAFELFENYPNPFAESTTISFSLPERGLVSLRVYDLLGRELTTVVHRELAAGEHQVELDGRSLTNGAYVVQLEAGGYSGSVMVVVAK